MRILFRTVFTAIALLALTCVPARAQTKIGTVDLKKLFDGYYKTKLATTAIQERADDLQKDYASMADDLKKHGDQYEATLESANDPAISDDERAHRKQTAADELKQLQDSKAAIDQFQRQAQVTLTDQKQRMRDNILTDIKKVVADKSKAAGDTLVLDTDAQTIDGTPVIVFGAGDNDLTDDVLKTLNAAAPPDMPDTTTTPVFMSTNTPPYSLPGATPSTP
jgi:Skp family chaperone for outer membrane proteins